MTARFPLRLICLTALAGALLATSACGSNAAPVATPTSAPTRAPASAAQVSTALSPLPAASPSAQGAFSGPIPTAGPQHFSSAPPMTIDQNKTYTATIVTTDGTMTANLYAKEDPVTVNNFVFLANDGFYNGVIFHRIIKGFMVQTGDPQGTGAGGPGYQFKDEPVTRKYVRGTLAMANAGPNTNGSQFFIVDQDYPLPPNYTIFGILTGDQSFATLDALASTPVTASATGEQSKPVSPPKIVTVTISAQ